MQRSQLVYQDTNGVPCNNDFHINFNGSFQCHGNAYPKNDIHLNLKFHHTGGGTAELVTQDINVDHGVFHCQTTFGSPTRKELYMEITFNHSCCEESKNTNCNNVCEWRLPNEAFSCGKPIINEESILFSNTDEMLNNEKNSFISSQLLFKRSKRSIYVNKRGNWTFPIIYAIDKELNNRTILSALNYISKHTCMTFKNSENNSLKKAQVIFVKNDSCSSFIGKPKNNFSDIFLTKSCSIKFRSVIHEIFHMLGMYHEHQRYDRDNYVEIFNDSIPEEWKDEFIKKYSGKYFSTFNFSYDYGSIMHYPSGTTKGKDKIMLKVKNIDPYNKMIGQSIKPSFSDLRILNLYYCQKNCSFSKWDCKNGGYRHWKSCTRCVCPRGYGGFKCTDSVYLPRSKGCNKQELEATDIINKLIENGYKNCNYRIIAKPNENIYINLYSVKTENKTTCISKQGLEIRYLEDKGITGLCLCGSYYDIQIISPSNEVYIEYYGLHKSHYFSLVYHVNPKHSFHKPSIWHGNTRFDIK
uniref:Metalloendopeptidase n=1 Tax=Parastrongyloides trichosuri TaxID=131310 RepID=A0A0N4Z5I4_PARTI